MEQKIKNFDRKIEQMMNEHAVAPPFGMWNRIASELETTEALPIAAAAPLAFIPRRAVIGLVAGVAVIGLSLVTAYMVTNHNAIQRLEAAKTVEMVASSIPVIVKESPSVVLEQVKEITAPKMKTTKQIAIAKNTDDRAIATETNLISNSNNDVSVPNQLNASNEKGLTTAYYFPPVDIVSPAKNVTEEIATVTPSQLAKQEADENIAEKKVRVSSSSNDMRVKIKRHKRGGFTYGSLNRLGKHKLN